MREFGLLKPPEGALQIPPVALPPTIPVIETDPPWHTDFGLPALAVESGLTVKVTVLVVEVHGAVALAVRVKMTVPLLPATGVNTTDAGVVVAPELLN